MNRKERQTLRRQRGTLSVCRLLFIISLVATILYLIKLAVCRKKLYSLSLKPVIMNLYKVVFSHHSPKDSEQGIKALVLAENDEQVYNWIASEPKTFHFFPCTIHGKKWKVFGSDEEQGQFVDSDGDHDGTGDDWLHDGKPEDFKARVLRLKGEINDEDYDFSDAYYGITLLGWVLLKKNITTDYTELIESGIAFDATSLKPCS